MDSLLYIDTDILIMRPVQHVWAHFYEFNSTQLAAVAPEHESRSAGCYNRFARHPYYGELGEFMRSLFLDVQQYLMGNGS